METGERKNIQARQSSDGSFEIFVGLGGLEEISEDEVSIAEIVEASKSADEQTSSKTVPIIVAVVLVLAVAIGGILLLKGDKKKRVDSDLAQVQGFRAYRGKVGKPRNSAVKTKRASKIKKQAPIKQAEKAGQEDSQEANIAWKLTGKEPTPANNVEARIQPNRNPSPESVEIVIHDEDKGDDIIDDENDDSKEIAAQKRLGLLPMGIPTINEKPFKNIKNLKPRLLSNDFPKFIGTPKIEPTSGSKAN